MNKYNTVGEGVLQYGVYGVWYGEKTEHGVANNWENSMVHKRIRLGQTREENSGSVHKSSLNSELEQSGVEHDPSEDYLDDSFDHWYDRRNGDVVSAGTSSVNTGSGFVRNFCLVVVLAVVAWGVASVLSPDKTVYGAYKASVSYFSIYFWKQEKE